MDKWEEINQRLQNAMLVTSRIQERHAAGLKDHREWLEDLTRVATEQSALDGGSRPLDGGS